MSNTDTALIAQIGKTIGLWGDLKLHIHTDFPEQFTIGSSYKTARGTLTIKSINFVRGIVLFTGFEDIDSAKKLTNTKIFANEDDTKNNCDLKDGQHFWFDVIGCSLYENDENLGEVVDIQRLGDTDYLYIKTDEQLVANEFAKSFLVPYINRYIISADTQAQKVYSKDAKDILEMS